MPDQYCHLCDVKLEGNDKKYCVDCRKMTHFEQLLIVNLKGIVYELGNIRRIAVEEEHRRINGDTNIKRKGTG